MRHSFGGAVFVWGMFMIPVLETERLILRWMVRGEFGAFAAIWAEPEVVRFIGG